MKKKILLVNGPNLNIIEKRENGLYSQDSLEQIQKWLDKEFKSFKLTWIQSNSEEKLIEAIQSMLSSKFDALVINPAAFTHTSIALLDALRSIEKPKVEVHFTNTHAREDYRQTKYTTKGVHFVIEGFGKISYFLALKGLEQLFLDGD